MKNGTLQQEILLLASATLSRNLLCSRDGVSRIHSLTGLEKMEEACWNGLLGEMLPEVFRGHPQVENFFYGKSAKVKHCFKSA